MPDWTEDLRRRLAPLRLSPSRESEIIEELSQHLDLRYEEFLDRGAPDVEARSLALEELRGPDVLAQHMRMLRQPGVPPPITAGAAHGSLIGNLWQDLRYAARVLRQQPSFAATAVLTLALGIGVNTTVFTFVNAVLIRGLPFNEPDRIVLARHARRARRDGGVYLGFRGLARRDANVHGPCGVQRPHDERERRRPRAGAIQRPVPVRELPSSSSGSAARSAATSSPRTIGRAPLPS